MTYLESFHIPRSPRCPENALEEAFELYEKMVGSLPRSVREFMKTVWEGEIPENVPHEIEEYSNNFMAAGVFMQALQNRGYYARATKRFAEYLKAINIGIVLDPFAGSGYMVKALREAGVPAIATDDYSWGFEGPAEKIDAVSALRKYGNEVNTVLLSWVPYGDSIDMTLWKLIRSEYRHLNVLVISEGEGGCIGSDAFGRVHRYWEEFDLYVTTVGLHDRAFFLPADDGLDSPE